MNYIVRVLKDVNVYNYIQLIANNVSLLVLFLFPTICKLIRIVLNG
jgi:hypothetical protein